MAYLSVVNFWKYQNADVWKKSRTHPPWFKMYVHRDREIDALGVHARLLWVELLAAATRYGNVLGMPSEPVDKAGENQSLSDAELEAKQLRSDCEATVRWISAETRIDPEVIAETLPKLIKGGWLSETSTPRRSRKSSRKTLDNPREQDVDVEVHSEKDQNPPPKTQTPSSDAHANGTTRAPPIDPDLELENIDWPPAPVPSAAGSSRSRGRGFSEKGKP